jgi:hypothetical protein
MQKLVGKSGETAIRQFAYVYRDFAFENKTAYELFIDIPSLKNEEVTGLLRETLDIIHLVLDSYIKDKTNLVHKSRALRSLLHGFVSLYSSGYFHGEVNLEESFEMMIDDFIFSIAHKQIETHN